MKKFWNFMVYRGGICMIAAVYSIFTVVIYFKYDKNLPNARPEEIQKAEKINVADGGVWYCVKTCADGKWDGFIPNGSFFLIKGATSKKTYDTETNTNLYD